MCCYFAAIPKNKKTEEAVTIFQNGELLNMQASKVSDIGVQWVDYRCHKVATKQYLYMRYAFGLSTTTVNGWVFTEQLRIGYPTEKSANRWICSCPTTESHIINTVVAIFSCAVIRKPLFVSQKRNSLPNQMHDKNKIFNMDKIHARPWNTIQAKIHI